jgi:hypothetical protein
MQLINLHSNCVKFRGLGRRFCGLPRGLARSLLPASLEVCVCDVNRLLIDKSLCPPFGPVYRSFQSILGDAQKRDTLWCLTSCGTKQNGSRDSSVSIVTRLEVARCCSIPGRVKGFFSSPKRVDRPWCPPCLLFSGQLSLALHSIEW